MGAFTLAEAQAQLAAWKQASLMVATSQSYEIEISGTRRKLTRANAAEISKQISYWAHIVNIKTRSRVRFATPMDL